MTYEINFAEKAEIVKIMNKNLNLYIEHTLLKPEATLAELDKLLKEAIKYNFKGVCINPVNIKYAKQTLSNTTIKVVTVIGFPLGANLPEIKAFETAKAIKDGADEIDMVINISDVKNGQYQKAELDIKKVVEAAQGKPVKVILETDLLTKEEIIESCKICISAGASFVKTSTGFVKNGIGATVDNVKLMYDIVSPHGLQVKASGGVRDKAAMLKMIESGAVRIGTSSGIVIMEGDHNDGNAGY